jgi:hypothetical protein
MVFGEASVTNRDVYYKAAAELTKAGFKPSRNGKHEIWHNADRSKGLAISHNIRDKNRARSLLRSVGIEARL